MILVKIVAYKHTVFPILKQEFRHKLWQYYKI